MGAPLFFGVTPLPFFSATHVQMGRAVSAGLLIDPINLAATN
jgi:hypothetical protein